MPEFDAELLRQVAEGNGAESITPPLKGSKRAVDKILEDYGGEASRIRDILRATIVVPSVRGAQAVLAELECRMDVVAGGHRLIAEPMADGYRGIKVNVTVAPGLLAEILISIPEMVEAKARLRPLYERAEEINRAAPGRSLTPYEAVEVRALRAKMREAYSKAWEAGLRRASSSN